MTSKLRSFWHHNKVPYLFLLPWLIGLIVLGIVPMIASLYLSFTNYDFFTTPDFIGVRNYIEMFTQDGRFMKSLSVTFRFVFLSVPLQLAFALILALMLNKGIFGLAGFRAIYYIPSLLGGSIAMAI